MLLLARGDLHDSKGNDCDASGGGSGKPSRRADMQKLQNRQLHLEASIVLSIFRSATVLIPESTQLVY